MSLDLKDERELRCLLALLRERGIAVRREKLTSGPSFRVKSGSCEVYGEDVLYIDKNLPSRQQISLLLDYLIDRAVPVPEEALENLSPASRALIETQREHSAASS